MSANLQDVINQTPLLERPRHSRVHPLRSIGNHSLRCYVKREDELGFGISGTKLRKYLSLLPFILKERPEHAIVVGSAHSSHVLSFSQLLIEHGISPIYFLLGSADTPLQGNFLFSSLFAQKEKIHWFPKSSWTEIDAIARAFAKKHGSCIAVPKGACCKEALPGALTLPLDILRNEEEIGSQFDHIFIDSGTGLTAVALILGFAHLKKNCTIHVVQMAGTPEEFHSLLSEMQAALPILSPSHPLFELHSPSIAPAFGSVNPEVFEKIVDLGRKEGFLTDPIFTAKLFLEGELLLKQRNLEGNALFIHSGGGLGLTGFQTQLAKKLIIG